jgi:hypothetical protein
MIVCLVWLSLMTRGGEIGMKSSAPGGSRGPGTFFTPSIRGTLAEILLWDLMRRRFGVHVNSAKSETLTARWKNLVLDSEPGSGGL